MNSKELQDAFTAALDKAAESVNGQGFSVVRPLLLREYAAKIHTTSVEKGFYDEPVVMDKVAAKLALIHSEVTETLEALRKSQGNEKVTEEIADILIRTLDLHDWLVELNLATNDLDKVMADKMRKNDARPPKHGHAWG